MVSRGVTMTFQPEGRIRGKFLAQYSQSLTWL